ncbi:hypothetical protein CUJ84_pRLN1000239 (plasmid) [Rhizobium leguminosarum]|uniref:Uncharacterized protein n=1 Tax=Rhizobium leguminosarum TaxID=384 RepID=A0A2K9ZBS7_RHILE|nr:hypothetical protein CUJ84_pRLN1000239 [Rhizobium leguminosarum]
MHQQQYGIVGSIPVKTGKLTVVAVRSWALARQNASVGNLPARDVMAPILRATCSGVSKAWIFVD